MSNTMQETGYERINDCVAVRISLASPQDIRSWSFGEVKKPETINYRTYKPERDGLFCERIFGPEKDYECSCGRYKGMKYRGMICDRCGVKVTHSRWRRKRMGHIELAAPVVHIWFFKSLPSRLGTLLDMKVSELEKIIYYQEYVVIDPGKVAGQPIPNSDKVIRERVLLTEEEYRRAREVYGRNFEAEMGAEAIKKLLQRIDLVKLSRELRQELAQLQKTIKAAGKAREEGSDYARYKELVRRLKVVEALRDSENRPEWMVLEVIPVIPPDLRPLVLLESGNFATSDLNDLYRRIINRNNRLKKLVDLNAPEVIIRNEKRMLQQAVDALIDNARCKRPVVGSSNRALKSLTDMIKGKQGRFRENLLGKRVDYSARSVIVVGPELKLHQCGLPKRIALELFQPFIIQRLRQLGYADTVKSARRLIERRDDRVWDILEEVTRHHPVLLNRAPTLHRMGIQAFEPVLIEGNAIRIHPLVCQGYNADFDGDQMAVHLPLSIEAQVEATVLMMSTNNIFSPAHGNPIISPSQDIVMGCYYLTAMLPGQLGEGRTFASLDEVHLAYALKKVAVHAQIQVRLPRGKKVVTFDGKDWRYLPAPANGIIQTTVGRVIFNEILDPRMPFYDVVLDKKALSRIIADCYEMLGRKATIELLDRMKEIGFQEATRSGLSFSTDDLRIPKSKEEIIRKAEAQVADLRKKWENGAITDQERYNRTIDVWLDATDRVKKEVMATLGNDERDGRPYLNPIYLMAQSGARGNVDQVAQLAGMRGLMSKPNRQIIETPIKSNFREGLTVLEYFTSTHGARKGLADTALKTAEAGHLTRKMIDVAQNVVVTMYDCGTTQGITKSALYEGTRTERPLREAIRGRVSRRNIVDPVTDEIIVRENELITPEIARRIEELGIDKLLVRSPMTCQAPIGVCQLCYGMDLSTGDLVELGMAVGIIAAQSIGEPGTQLTMRTFHIGGVAKVGAEESSIQARREGVVKLEMLRWAVNSEGQRIVLNRNGQICILDARGRELEKYYVPVVGARLLVEDGQRVKEGDKLCEWDPNVTPIIARDSGVVEFEDIVEGDTLEIERDFAGRIRMRIRQHKGDRHPTIVIKSQSGATLDAVYIPEGAYLEVREGQYVTAGTVLAKKLREATGTQDITGGLPRVNELFEARKPKDMAVVAEIDGIVELVTERGKRRRKIIIYPTDERGQRMENVPPVEVLVPPGKQLLVHTGDHVKTGDPLTEGALNPKDLLRVKGPEAVQEYLLREIQAVYRSQKVEIDDKHIEIIIAQMMRKIEVEDPGDTRLLPDSLVDKFAFRRINEELRRCCKIKNPGDSDFKVGEIVPRDVLEREVARLQKEGKQPPTWSTPKPATGRLCLLGVSRAAVQSDSFISAASFQETTKVLVEAAISGKTDYLIGLKENVILGHLIPAGTGFRAYVDAEVRISPEALQELGRSLTEVTGPAPTPASREEESSSVLE
ncbi:MAG: DNA-directed RNA polymerase subunit beta' [Gemmatales bacterium]|nr:DNA-directed RNA polymerase subunit beta' [Gemmatales bacterium]MDW7995901.1 DNA-directed RNA polymerase subunit beta' [Gemmatales bacterium]